MSHWRKLNLPSFSKPISHDSNHTGPASGLQQAIHNPETAVEPLVVEMQPFCECAKGEYLEKSRGKTEKTPWGYCWKTSRSGVLKKGTSFQGAMQGPGQRPGWHCLRHSTGLTAPSAEPAQLWLQRQTCVTALPLQKTSVSPNRTVITGGEGRHEQFQWQH